MVPMIRTHKLTANQQNVCDEIIRTWQCGELLPNLRHRCTPFVTGASGSGKTTTVRAALAGHYRQP